MPKRSRTQRRRGGEGMFSNSNVSGMNQGMSDTYNKMKQGVSGMFSSASAYGSNAMGKMKQGMSNMSSPYMSNTGSASVGMGGRTKKRRGKKGGSRRRRH